MPFVLGNQNRGKKPTTCEYRIVTITYLITFFKTGHKISEKKPSWVV
jgi:hypothetical protein